MENRKITENIIIENARLMFRNFSGNESAYNRAGDRNFCVVIDDPQTASKLKADGWNIKTLPSRDDDEEPTNYIRVRVKFDPIPPHIYLVTEKNKTLLDETTVGSLDYVEIKNADVIIRPYNWTAAGNSGVSAYVKTMYVTIEEDVFAHKYE